MLSPHIYIHVINTLLRYNVVFESTDRCLGTSFRNYQEMSVLVELRHITVSPLTVFISSSVCSADSPLLWIRIDPDMSILRKVEFEQSDFMWQYQLRYERDVVAQVSEWQVSTLQFFLMTCKLCCYFIHPH